jgi:hypothetical protein
MNWNISYQKDEDNLYIKTKGMLTAEEADKMVREVVKAAQYHRCDRQIVDHRETTFALSLVEYYERPNINQKIGASQRWAIAMVFRELTHETQFMETVFCNRGFNFRQFDDIEKAKAWILDE